MEYSLVFVFVSPEPCQVEVRLLLAYNSGARIPKSPWLEGSEMSPQVETSIEGTIPFSKPVKVYIMPKPARRWPTSSHHSHGLETLVRHQRAEAWMCMYRLEEHLNLIISFHTTHRINHFCIKTRNLLVSFLHSHNKVEKTPSCSSFWSLK